MARHWRNAEALRAVVDEAADPMRGISKHPVLPYVSVVIGVTLSLLVLALSPIGSVGTESTRARSVASRDPAYLAADKLRFNAHLQDQGLNVAADEAYAHANDLAFSRRAATFEYIRPVSFVLGLTLVATGLLALFWRRTLPYLAPLAIVLGVGLVVFGISRWGYCTDPRFRTCRGWPQDATYVMAVGAMLLAAGVLGKLRR